VSFVCPVKKGRRYKLDMLIKSDKQRFNNCVVNGKKDHALAHLPNI